MSEERISRQIEVEYCCRSRLTNTTYASGSHRFHDWYDFADWLRENTLESPVLITGWKYV